MSVLDDVDAARFVKLQFPGEDDPIGRADLAIEEMLQEFGVSAAAGPSAGCTILTAATSAAAIARRPPA